MNTTDILPIGTGVKMNEMGKGKTYFIRAIEEDMLGIAYVIPPFLGSFTTQSFRVVSIPAPKKE